MNINVIFWFCIVIIVIGQILTVVGTFKISYKNLTFWEAYKITAPYLIAQRVCGTIAVNFIHKYNFFTNNQVVFLILVLQFIFTSIYSSYVLKKYQTTSDYIGMILLIYAYVISYYKHITTFFF
jgi:hypothetical protein